MEKNLSASKLKDKYNSNASNYAERAEVDELPSRLTMLMNHVLFAILFISQEFSMFQSVLGTKRVVFQTFFDNMHASCYGTCTQADQGFAGATTNVRCHGNKVRLECDRDLIIKTRLAFYGKLEPGKELCKDVSYVFEQCHKDVLGMVESNCNDKQFCVFKVDRRFKDFCTANYFYLDVRYECELPPTTPRPTTTLATTTTRPKETTATTTRRTTAAKPITIYRETERKTTTTTTNDRTTDAKTRPGSSTPSKTKPKTSTEGKTKPKTSTESRTKSKSSTKGQTKSKSSSTGNKSSSTTTTTMNVPIAAVTSAAPYNKSVVVDSGGRTSGKKSSMYWFLTTYSLVTDKNFINANATHLALAVILSIFISLVLSICFILDHCRRRKRYQALKEANHAESPAPGATTAAAVENGVVDIDLEMRRGLIRPKGKPRGGSILVTNGRSSRQNSISLEEINHNSVESERLPLVPLTASLSSIKPTGLEESSFMLRSSISDGLPPPPEELLADSPLPIKSRFLYEESDASTISIPPPIGFGDSEGEDGEITKYSPNVVITSPTPTNSSVSSTHTHLRGDVSIIPGQNIQNTKRLNNEMYHGISNATPDANLLLNNASVQTNDLSQGYDRRDKFDNPGYVSMKSPESEETDNYAAADEVSDTGSLEVEFLMKEKQPRRTNNIRGLKEDNELRHEEANNDNQGSQYDSMGRENRIKAKKGKLMVIKSRNSEPLYKEDMANSGARERTRIEEIKPQETMPHSTPIENARPDASANVLTKLPITESSASSANKQILTIPKHRCGLGHSHSCVCTPHRTGVSSFICSCLEKSKQKNSVCCIENCPEQTSTSGIPYSAQRPPRYTDTLKRKGHKDRRRTSSLTDISNALLADKKTVPSHSERKAITKNGKTSALKSATLSRIPKTTDKVLPSTDVTMSLDRGKTRQTRVPNGDVSNKLIAVTVHSSKSSKGSHNPRFEPRIAEDKGLDSKHSSRTHHHTSRSEESSDSSERSDNSVEIVRTKSLPASPTGKSHQKNGKVRLSPISEDHQRNKATPTNTSWPKRSPKFKIQVVQSLHTEKRKPINDV